jgi:phosphoribosylglycinamide formyltransferase-1
MVVQTKLAVFVSGNGSNARNLISHFHDHSFVNIALLVSSRPNSQLKSFASAWGITYLEVTPWSEEEVLTLLEKSAIHGIVLAGFLRKISAALITRFPHRIINLHPSLLPKHGGKGMYGRFVHEAVFLAKEKETGITIHFVTEAYDEGRILVQVSCPISLQDSVDRIEEKVRRLERRFFPEAVMRFCEGL